MKTIEEVKEVLNELKRNESSCFITESKEYECLMEVLNDEDMPIVWNYNGKYLITSDDVMYAPDEAIEAIKEYYEGNDKETEANELIRFIRIENKGIELSFEEHDRKMELINDVVYDMFMNEFWKIKMNIQEYIWENEGK